MTHTPGVDNILCSTHPDYKKPNHPLFSECPIGCEEGYLPDAKQAWDVSDAPEVECPYCSLKEKANALYIALKNVCFANDFALSRENNLNGWPNSEYKREAEKALKEYR